MILFKPWHVNLIIDGFKTQTRRTSKRRPAVPGSLHLAKLKMLSKEAFARLKIIDCKRERLGDISEEDCWKEGKYTPEEFRKIWIEINGSWEDDLEVWVIDFRVESIFCAGCDIEIIPCEEGVCDDCEPWITLE